MYCYLVKWITKMGLNIVSRSISQLGVATLVADRIGVNSSVSLVQIVIL